MSCFEGFDNDSLLNLVYYMPKRLFMAKILIKKRKSKDLKISST